MIAHEIGQGARKFFHHRWPSLPASAVEPVRFQPRNRYASPLRDIKSQRPMASTPVAPCCQLVGGRLRSIAHAGGQLWGTAAASAARRLTGVRRDRLQGHDDRIGLVIQRCSGDSVDAHADHAAKQKFRRTRGPGPEFPWSGG